MRRITRTPRARQDLIDIWTWIGEGGHVPS